MAAAIAVAGMAIAVLGPSLIVRAVAIPVRSVGRARQEADIMQGPRRIAVARSAVGAVLLLRPPVVTIGAAGAGTTLVAVARLMLTMPIAADACLVATCTMLRCRLGSRMLTVVGPRRGAFRAATAVIGSGLAVAAAIVILATAAHLTCAAMRAAGALAILAMGWRAVGNDRGVVAAILVRDLLAREALDSAELIALLGVAK